MKRTLLIVLLLGLSTLQSFTADAHTLSVDVKDKFVAGKGLTVYDGPVVQTDLFLVLPSCFTLDLWWSTSVNGNLNGDFGDEIDLTVSCSGRVANFNVAVGLGYFDLFRLFSQKGGDVVQPYVDISREFRIGGSNFLIPYARAEIIIPVGWEGDAKAGVHFFAGATWRWQIHQRVAFNQKFSLMYDTGTFVNFNSALLGSYDAGLTWKVMESISITLPTFQLISPFSSPNDGRKTERAIGGRVGYNF